MRCTVVFTIPLITLVEKLKIALQDCSWFDPAWPGPRQPSALTLWVRLAPPRAGVDYPFTITFGFVQSLEFSLVWLHFALMEVGQSYDDEGDERGKIERERQDKKSERGAFGAGHTRSHGGPPFLEWGGVTPLKYLSLQRGG